MHISILTLFPDMFAGPFRQSILKRAQDQGLLSVSFVDIREFAADRYKSVDGHPYGGGVGMILRVDVVDRALQHAKSHTPHAASKTILLDAGGKRYTQNMARSLSNAGHLILVCGHYEGVDERVRALVDEEISIGPYVLTGGEIPAMVLVDSIARLMPGVLPKPEAVIHESFTRAGELEYPQYTEPRTYNGQSVPEILLSGNHANIQKWRETEAQKRTTMRRRSR